MHVLWIICARVNGMKHAQKQSLARKYAQACVNIFNQQMSYDDCIALNTLAAFLSTHSHIFFFFYMPFIEDSVKLQAYDILQELYNVPSWLKSLFTLLLNDKRLFLFIYVLREICVLYAKKANIDIFTITSAHALIDQQQKECSLFLSHITRKKIITHFALDKSLVAGIRMQSNEMLWEHSIKKQLRAMHQFFCPIGEDYGS